MFRVQSLVLFKLQSKVTSEEKKIYEDFVLENFSLSKTKFILDNLWTDVKKYQVSDRRPH